MKPPALAPEEAALFDCYHRELYTPVVGDILDQMGYTHQFLPQPIQPLLPSMKVVGRAMPVLMIDVFGPQKKPFGLLTEALDQLRPGEVYFAVGGMMRCAYWGELLTATARTRGAVGAVVDGFHRDTPQVLAQEWPVFSRGPYAQDSSVRTQVVDFRCPVECGAVTIAPGDLIFGDHDGVLVVPAAHVEEVTRLSLEKARGEKVVRKAIEDGMTATEAFAKFGIL
jgi:Demethylmenaquinone methyltransferase